jgi:hypothetical protein
MTKRFRTTIVPANAVNLVAVVNENIVDNVRRQTPPDIKLPALFDRAFMCHYEDTVMPILEELPEGYVGGK